MENQKIEIKNNCSVIEAKNAMLDMSTFEDVSMRNISILDANLSELKIDGAQIGGAIIKNIGAPDESHPNYNPDLKQKPIAFEMCDLNASIFKNCDLRNVVIENCNISGLIINGISISSILEGNL